jgi:hypothetical protein
MLNVGEGIERGMEGGCCLENVFIVNPERICFILNPDVA